MDSMQLQFKRDNFTDKQILDKEHTLQHLMKPDYLGKMKNQLEDVGFGMVESFWRNFNFVGFVCIKTPDGFDKLRQSEKHQMNQDARKDLPGWNIPDVWEGDSDNYPEIQSPFNKHKREEKDE